MDKKMNGSSSAGGLYGALGASASKEGVHEALERAGIDVSHDVFITLAEDLAGDPEHRSFAHADGAGTKAIIPYLIFRETGSRSAFAGLAQDALVMNLDDVMSAGLPERMLLSNTIGRNALLVDDGCVEEIVRGYRAVVELLGTYGVRVELAGGETADCGDTVRTLVVDATLVGRMRLSSVVRTSRIAPGDRIVGLASGGRASYEPRDGSGIGSNGLTLARHVLLSGGALKRYPEVWCAETDPAAAYRGPFNVTDSPAGLGMTVGEALASPTRTYAPLLSRLHRELGSDLHGIIHLTGGAHSKVLRFVRGVRLVKESLLPVPPIFRLIAETGRVAPDEMFRVFNMGCRMELYVPDGRVDHVLRSAAELGIDAAVVGAVEAHPAGSDAPAEVILRYEGQTVTYRGK